MNISIIFDDDNYDAKQMARIIRLKYQNHNIKILPINGDFMCTEEQFEEFNKGNIFVIIIDPRKQCCNSILAHHLAERTKEASSKNKVLGILCDSPLRTKNFDELIILEKIFSRDIRKSFSAIAKMVV